MTAGVIALGIIAYGVFRIDTENTASVLLGTQDGSRPIMIGGNAISQLIGRTKLETMILFPVFSKWVLCMRTPWVISLMSVPGITCD